MSQLSIPKASDIKLDGNNNRTAIGSHPRPVRSGVMVIGNQKPAIVATPQKPITLSIGTKKPVLPIDNTLSIVPKKPSEPKPNVLESGPVIVLPDLSQQIQLEMTKLDALESEINSLEQKIWQEKKSFISKENIHNKESHDNKNSFEAKLNDPSPDLKKSNIKDQSQDSYTANVTVSSDVTKTDQNPAKSKTQTPQASLLKDVTSQNSAKIESYSNSNATLFISLSGFCLALMPLVFLTLPATSLIINSFLFCLVLGFFFGFRRAKVMEARASLKEQMYRSFQQYLDQKS